MHVLSVMLHCVLSYVLEHFKSQQPRKAHKCKYVAQRVKYGKANKTAKNATKLANDRNYCKLDSIAHLNFLKISHVNIKS